MKKMYRSAWIAGTSVVLLSMLAAGCGTKTETTVNKPAASGTAAPEKRGNITVAVYDNGKVPADQGTMEKNWLTEWLNKNGPVDVKFVPIPRTKDTEKYNLLFASGDAPDLIWSYDSALKAQLISQKQVMPLEDLIDKSSTTYKKLLGQFPSLKKLSTSPDGHIYQIGKVNAETVTPNFILTIRQDWLKKLNLPIPQTTEDLYNTAVAFATKDPDGNGKADTYGMNLSFVGGLEVDQIFGNIPPIIENGKAINPWDRLQAATDFKKKLFDAGAVDKEFLLDKDGAKAKQAFTNGKLGIYGYYVDRNPYDALLKNDANADVVAIAYPKGPYGQFSGALNPSAQVVGLVNAKAKDPKAVMKFIDFLSEPATMKMMKYGEEGTDYKLDNGCPVLVDKDNPKFKFTDTFNILNSLKALEPKCGSPLLGLKPDTNPSDKMWATILQKADEYYTKPERPWPGMTWAEFMPSMPSDLQTINSTVSSQITDIVNKAIVSGTSYSTEQAIKDAKERWEKSGGKDIDAWYDKWYGENKDKAFLTKDLYLK
ncbi:type 2 periplasmic-binding domain-containing protein [Paenibacillus roseipurpureus]|uniref:Extracellular solute-binding protein n=1 Tax=Paenibacillus roseopurpureus TaxID=2918901 RepID=A0AA96LT95_9BACL|nr:extracellular solute-binding protein [Paenibacillus sp. MBLB1832]WNR45553.1 extracellular solute-binding protein [Paenibacillus sp. MBLB1832]